MYVIEFKFYNFQKKKAHVVYFSYYNIVIVGINIFQFYISIISNLKFSFITFFIPLNDCMKSGNILISGFNFFNRFSIQFPNIIFNSLV
jgi:hypothetical protein